MYKIIFIIISLLFISCEDEINFPFQQENKVQLNALLGNDSLFNFHLTNPNNESIKMSLFANDKTYPITNISRDFYGIRDFYIKKNNKYEITLEFDNNIVKAETKIPSKVYIDSVSIDNDRNIKYFTFNFYDKPEERNYYMVLITSLSNASISFTSNDQVFKGNLDKDYYQQEENAYYGSCVFTDDTFNGQLAIINIDKPLFTNNKFKLNLYHISESYYKYERAYVSSRNIADVPSFSEKNIYSNIKGIEGIFASYSLDYILVGLN